MVPATSHGWRLFARYSGSNVQSAPTKCTSRKRQDLLTIAWLQVCFCERSKTDPADGSILKTSAPTSLLNTSAPTSRRTTQPTIHEIMQDVPAFGYPTKMALIRSICMRGAHPEIASSVFEQAMARQPLHSTGSATLLDTVHEFSVRAHGRDTARLFEVVESLGKPLAQCSWPHGLTPVAAMPEELLALTGWLNYRLVQQVWTGKVYMANINRETTAWLRWQSWTLLLNDELTGPHEAVLEYLVHREIRPNVRGLPG